NWAFFFDGNQLKAYYTLSPCRVISGDSRNMEADTITFRDEYVSNCSLYKPLTIGTQLLQLDDGHGLIAHRKIHLFGKRIYYGVPVRIRFVEGAYFVE